MRLPHVAFGINHFSKVVCRGRIFWHAIYKKGTNCANTTTFSWALQLEKSAPQFLKVFQNSHHHQDTCPVVSYLRYGPSLLDTFLVVIFRYQN